MEAKLDTETVDVLMEVLSQARQADGAVNEDSVHDPSVFDVQGEHRRMSTLFKSLPRLKASRDTLQTLLQIINSRIDTIQTECTPYFLVKGIKSLPDEVLRHAFEVGYEDEDIRACTKFSVHVAGISRRFRRVALDSPRLWRRLHNYMSPTLLELLVSRTKDAGLQIYLTDKWHPRKGGSQLMKIAAPQSRRWESFVFHFHNPATGMKICQKFSNLNLPRLSALSLHCPDYTGCAVGEIRRVANIWTLPRLRHLSLHNAIIDGAARWTSLSTCEIILDESYEGDGRDVWQVLRGLRAMLSLESLLLRFDDFQGFGFDPKTERVHLSMPSLRTLTYIFERSNQKFVITPLISGIQLPRLLNLHVEFRWCEDVQVDRLFEGHNPYLSLRTFSLSEYECPLGECKLAMVQKAVPSLMHVSLKGVFKHISPPDPGHSWESLRIEGLNDIKDENITSIAEALMDDPAFQRMDIIGCRSISLRCLMVLKGRMGRKLCYELSD